MQKVLGLLNITECQNCDLFPLVKCKKKWRIGWINAKNCSLSTTYNGEMTHRKQQKQVDLWPFDLESGIRVTCDVCYICTNFSLPRRLCSRLMSNERDRQTDVRRQTTRRASSLNAPYPRGGGIIMNGDITLSAPCQCQRASKVISPFIIFAVAVLGQTVRA